MIKIVTDKDKITRYLDRRFREDRFKDLRFGLYPSKEEVINRLSSGDRLSFYYGIDPTGPDIHLGHTVQLLLLKDLATLGHEIIVLIGDFTAKIGDPTGKDVTRRPLSDKEIKENMANYLSQVYKIIPKKYLKIKYNSQWLKKISMSQLVDIASKVTVQQMIIRDMFQERIKNEKPIGVHEFLYPLMQGYDSVAMKIDGEIGGNDQTFNMLVGRDIERFYLRKDKMVLATPLLVDTDTGKKMSKSEGSLIAVNDSPNDVFGKVMRFISDEMIKNVFYLCTEVSEDKIEEYAKIVESGGNPKDFKIKLGYELVRMYHGDERAREAQEEFERVFQKKELPGDIKEYKIGEQKEILELIKNSGLVDSRSEAKRLIDQGAIELNGQTVGDWKKELKPGDVLKIGARRFLKIK